mgnify:FL=1
MYRHTLLFIFILSCFSGVVLASDFSGDGVHNIKKEDTITLDNGWKIQVLRVGLGSTSEVMDFQLYDPEGIAYPQEPYQNTIKKVEGKKKFGTSEILKVQIELLEVSGQELARAGASWVEKENAQISVVSIDEALPGVVGRGMKI